MLDKQNEKGDRLTRAIRNGGLCAILKFCSPPEHSCRLKVLHPQTATSYSPYPLGVIRRNPTHYKQSKFKKRQLQTYASSYTNYRLEVWCGTLKT